MIAYVFLDQWIRAVNVLSWRSANQLTLTFYGLNGLFLLRMSQTVVDKEVEPIQDQSTRKFNESKRGLHSRTQEEVKLPLISRRDRTPRTLTNRSKIHWQFMLRDRSSCCILKRNRREKSRYKSVINQQSSIEISNTFHHARSLTHNQEAQLEAMNCS